MLHNYSVQLRCLPFLHICTLPPPRIIKGTDFFFLTHTSATYFLFISYTHTQWVLNLGPHPPSSTYKGEQVPVEQELNYLTHATLMSIRSKRANMQSQIPCWGLFFMLKIFLAKTKQLRNPNKTKQYIYTHLKRRYSGLKTKTL